LPSKRLTKADPLELVSSRPGGHWDQWDHWLVATPFNIFNWILIWGQLWALGAAHYIKTWKTNQGEVAVKRQ